MARKCTPTRLVSVLVLSALGYGFLYRRLLTGMIQHVDNASYQGSEPARTYSDASTRKVLETSQLNALTDKLLMAQDRKYILRWYGKNKTNPRIWRRDLCGNCELTNDRSLLHHPDTGAVVFLYNQIDPKTMPSPSSRRVDQLHVWYTAEAPASLYLMRKKTLSYEDSYQFNVTQTYRRDSDIYHPYGVTNDILETLENRGLRNIESILRNKTNLAVAVVSNCNATAGASVRLELIKQLVHAGLRLEAFGRCFNQTTLTKSEAHDFEASLTKYKFFLAFENSYHCRDYITEKFFINGLRSGTVPIAWGAKREDYEAIAPPHSFIFLEDFASGEDLVQYLNYLDGNETAYSEYFRWHQRKRDDEELQDRAVRFCQLCRQIHGINVDDVYSPSYNSSQPERPLFTKQVAYRSVPSLRTWYYGTENKECYERDVTALKKLTRMIF